MLIIPVVGFILAAVGMLAATAIERGWVS